jgi:hypothetical protein
MRRLRLLVRLGGALACLALPGAASAQSTNAQLTLVQGTATVDPSTLTLDDTGKKSITDAISSLKNGSLLAYVMAATPDGKYWATATGAKGYFASVADVARRALESCEYITNLGPCIIMTINGHNSQYSDGGWPAQPPSLEINPGAKFDSRTIPFVALSDRSEIATGYPEAPKPRALVITESGGWFWNPGKTMVEAVDKSYAACQKSYPNDTCILYAVNDNVVFSN